MSWRVRRRAANSNAWPDIPYCKKSPSLLMPTYRAPAAHPRTNNHAARPGMNGVADMLQALLVALASYRRCAGLAIVISDLEPAASARGAARAVREPGWPHRALP